MDARHTTVVLASTAAALTAAALLYEKKAPPKKHFPPTDDTAEVAFAIDEGKPVAALSFREAEPLVAFAGGPAATLSVVRRALPQRPPAAPTLVLDGSCGEAGAALPVALRAAGLAVVTAAAWLDDAAAALAEGVPEPAVLRAVEAAVACCAARSESPVVVLLPRGAPGEALAGPLGRWYFSPRGLFPMPRGGAAAAGDVDIQRVATPPRPPRGYSVKASRGAAAAGDVDIPWIRIAAPPRLPRGYSAKASRGAAAAGDVDIPW